MPGMLDRDPFAVLGPHVESAETDRHPDDAAGGGGRGRPSAEGAIARRRWSASIGRVCGRRGSPVDSGTTGAPDYRLRVAFADGHELEIDDPYRYGRVLTRLRPAPVRRGHAPAGFREVRRAPDLESAGRRRALRRVGAQRRSRQRGRRLQRLGRPRHPMRLLVPAGVWEIFIPDFRTARNTSSRSARRPGRCCTRPIRSASRSRCRRGPRRSSGTSRGYEWRDRRLDSARASAATRGSTRPMSDLRGAPRIVGARARRRQSHRSRIESWPSGSCRT